VDQQQARRRQPSQYGETARPMWLTNASSAHHWRRTSADNASSCPRKLFITTRQMAHALPVVRLVCRVLGPVAGTARNCSNEDRASRMHYCVGCEFLTWTLTRSSCVLGQQMAFMRLITQINQPYDRGNYCMFPCMLLKCLSCH
jgi:hypothetical protein